MTTEEKLVAESMGRAWEQACTASPARWLRGRGRSQAPADEEMTRKQEESERSWEAKKEELLDAWEEAYKKRLAPQHPPAGSHERPTISSFISIDCVMRLI